MGSTTSRSGLPCKLHFKGTSETCRQSAAKAEKLIRHILPEATRRNEDLAVIITQEEPPTKKPKIDDIIESQERALIWVKLDTTPITLSYNEKETIVNDEMLSDIHINFAQSFLRQQFGPENGFYSTLLQTTCSNHPKLQIVHDRGNHWLVASTIFSEKDEVIIVYDSVYSSLDANTVTILKNLFGALSSFQVANTRKQTGGKDCSLFAIATSTLLACNFDPVKVTFVQQSMRPHLVNCFEEGKITTFPMVLL